MSRDYFLNIIYFEYIIILRKEQSCENLWKCWFDLTSSTIYYLVIDEYLNVFVERSDK